ncbi:MAG: trimethylamine methyltransferase family protein, partial [Yoonia sp.]|uniref:trimethylamine methyltransferase family protein n=1 Tax=Yoonia sp. TaxID=2212373 RepID=UPI003EF8D4F8
LERLGAPTIIGSFMNSMAMRSGSPTFGTPEPAAASLIMGQFARRYKLPLRCAGNFTTSKLPDGQAMQQSMMSAMSAVQSGANFIMHMAGYLDGLLSMSYEKLVMDMDICGALHAYLQGVDVNEETLGFDALAEGGPGAHMFGTQHTLRHYETAYWDSALDDNTPWETWDDNGRVDMATRANRRWKTMLAQYQAPDIDNATDDALKAFIAQRKDAMPDSWH